MALVTVQCSSSVTGSTQCNNSESELEEDEASKNRKNESFFAGKDAHKTFTLENISKSCVDRHLSVESLHSTNSTQSNNSDIQQHLQSMFYLLRHEETLKMAVKLESQRSNRTRYLVIASRCCKRCNTVEKRNKIIRRHSTRSLPASTYATLLSPSNINPLQLSMDSSKVTSHEADRDNRHNFIKDETEKVCGSGDGGVSSLRKSVINDMSHNFNIPEVNCNIDSSEMSSEDVEESCLLGIDCNERTTIGLVVPILADTTIHLDGDGGFSVSVYGKTHIFKPVSVQAMWSALQTLHKVSQKARENNYYPGGPSHDWLSYYDKCIESEQSCLNEWNAMDSLESRRPPSPDAIRNKPTAKEETESIIKMKLKEIMMSVDLDEVTSKYIRSRLEELLDMDLGEFKSFIDGEMLTILGQMDAPTEIFEHVYLGSEWNASNLEELQKNGVRHILNVTREIDNFFPGTFDYLNVRVYDDEKTNLLKHWDNTYRYITRAKAEGSKVLVHCKMGVSRSASVVIAYAMKAYNWEFQKALQHVKERRSCIKPNKNFLNQLETYRGMLDAMKNKEKLQRSKSETNLKSTKDARLLPGSEPTPLIQALNYSKTKFGNDNRTEDRKCLNSLSLGIEDIDKVERNLIQSSIRRINTCKVDARRRRSNSTSPKTIKSGSTLSLIVKQQSQSLENLTPERNIVNEPKNMRFPGSNGENYSVTQNQVLHIQKNTRIQWSSSLLVEQTEPAVLDSVSTVRDIVHDLEAHQLPENNNRNTNPNTYLRKNLNLYKLTSKSSDPKLLGNTIWTSSSKLVTQISNNTASDSIYNTEHNNAHKHQYNRKTLSWTASSGGIIVDNAKQNNTKTKPATNQSTNAPAVTYGERLERTRQRMPSRHSSWGSGDTKCDKFIRKSSWEEYDCNCNNKYTHCIAKSNAKDARNQIGELNSNTNNKTALVHYLNPSNSLGTVKRTKQKLERDATLKKICQETSVSVVHSELDVDSVDTLRFKKNCNLMRSASVITSQTRFTQRCNSEEIVHNVSNSSSTKNERHKNDNKVYNAIYSSSAPNSYLVSDVENKNVLVSDRSHNNNCEEIDNDVILRNKNSMVKTIDDDEQHRLSGNVQILKKSFEKKANFHSNSNALAILPAPTATPTTIIKSHQSLPASPVAQHINYNDQKVNVDIKESCDNRLNSSYFMDLNVASNITPLPSVNNLLKCLDKGNESQRDYVKILVHKYQATSPIKTQYRKSNTYNSTGPSKNFTSTVKARPRSCYESKRPLVGNFHEFTNNRPPPAPTKSTTSSIISENAMVHQEPLQQRRLQQHGRTHPLSRLSLPKHTFNAAAYNTM